jgi:hypothetical protein
VGGDLVVEEGVLLVEEFARSAEVVDLSDPAFFNVSDTTLFSLRPVFRASRNPFLQNLRLDLRLSLGRDSWLRGRDLNVEMGGELDVFWDRLNRDLALVGTLQAVRGVYSVVGRQFQVREGTVSFQGTPGVLSSNAPFPIAESDLVSYLIFGRPSYALASGQTSLAQGAASSLLRTATGAGVTLGIGAFANELGSVFTRDMGLDYLAISQGQYGAPLGTQDLYGTVATTQVEVGQYLTEDIFAVLLWRPLTGFGGTAQSPFAGLRMEWRMADLWTLEGFVEDRFARNSLFWSGDLRYRLDKVFGAFLYREWGY